MSIQEKIAELKAQIKMAKAVEMEKQKHYENLDAQAREMREQKYAANEKWLDLKIELSQLLEEGE